MVDLNRHYVREQSEHLQNFKQLLVDSNFFGNYHSYITEEIKSFRANYLHKKEELQKDTDTNVLISTEMAQMKAKIKKVLENDIAKFEAVLVNVRKLV